MEMNYKQRQEYIKNLQDLQQQLINNLEGEIQKALNEKNDYCKPKKLQEKLLLVINNKPHIFKKEWYL